MSLASRNTTPAGFNASIWWPRIAWLLAAIVATTAAIARQQIVAETTTPTVAAPAAALTDGFPGIVRPRDVTTIALPTPVVVRRVAVTVGDHVTPGQTLIELDDEEARRVVAQLTFDVASAKAQTKQLEETVELLDRSIHSLTMTLAARTAELAAAQRAADAIPTRQWKDSPERAQAAYEQAAAHERRVSSLAANGVASRQDLEDAQIAVRLAADDLAVAKKSAEAQQKVLALQAEQARVQAELTLAEQRRTLADRNGDLAQARLRLAQAQTALDTATTRLNDLAVKAASGGLVAEVAVKTGDRVLAGAPLLKVAQIDPMVVDVDVPPTVVNTLRRGETAHVQIPGTPETYEGRILTIAPLPGDGGAHALEVEFKNPTRLLLAGRAAHVRFVATR